MKICIFTHTTPRFAGDTAAPFIEQLAMSLVERGHKVWILTPWDKEIKRTKRNYKMVSYRYIYPPSYHLLGYSRTLKGDKSMSAIQYLIAPFMYLFGFIALFKLVRKEKIDVVSTHWIVPNGFIAAFVKLFTGVPYTSTIPGSDVFMGGKGGAFFFVKYFVGFASFMADYVLSDSSHYIEQLHDLGAKGQREKVIRYGVNSNKFKPANRDKKLLKQYGLKENDKILVAVGRMVAKKGYIYLINAMPEIVKKVPGVKLVMVGDGELKSELEARVKKLNIAKNVIFTGTISYDDLVKYYNLANVFVMSSVKDEDGNLDASPVAMMEAMSTGAAVIATKFAGSEDLIDEGETGYLVKEKDSRAIARSAVNLLLKGNATVQGKKVRGVAMKNFSLKVIGKKYEEVFDEVISSNNLQ